MQRHKLRRLMVAVLFILGLLIPQAARAAPLVRNPLGRNPSVYTPPCTGVGCAVGHLPFVPIQNPVVTPGLHDATMTYHTQQVEGDIVSYGPYGDVDVRYAQSVRDSKPTTNHYFHLTGLNLGSKYGYTIYNGRAYQNGSFMTLPVSVATQ